MNPEVAAKDPLRILIVDDDRDTAESLTDLLRHWGHDTLTVFEGQDALTSVIAYAPHVVILDLSMPGVDGFKLAKHVTSSTSTKKSTLIAHTGYGGDEYREKAVASGIDFYLLKPVDPEFLRVLLESIPKLQ